MRHLHRVQFLIRILPFRSRWSRNLRHHLEHCRACQEDMASLEEARTATVFGESIDRRADSWPLFVQRLEEDTIHYDIYVSSNMREPVPGIRSFEGQTVQRTVFKRISSAIDD